MTNGNMVLLQGIPGSGKSTWVAEEKRKLNAKGIEHAVASRDDIRFFMFGSYTPGYSAENMVTEVRDEMIYTALKNGRTVFVDEMNLRSKYIRHLVKIAKRTDATVSLKSFNDVPLKTCLERNANRDRVVPEHVIINAHKKHVANNNVDYEKLIAEERYVHDEDIYTPNKNLPSAYIFDIDGTLAINEGDRGWYDWGSVGLDKPNLPVIDACRSLHEAGHSIIVMSGRDSVCRSETIDWLNEYNVPFHEIYMREEGSQAKDTIVKRELFNLINDRYWIKGVFDDRKSVIEMWQNLGLLVFDVGGQDNDF